MAQVQLGFCHRDWAEPIEAVEGHDKYALFQRCRPGDRLTVHFRARAGECRVLSRIFGRTEDRGPAMFPDHSRASEIVSIENLTQNWNIGFN